jgi:hypothetical protein
MHSISHTKVLAVYLKIHINGTQNKISKVGYSNKAQHAVYCNLNSTSTSKTHPKQPRNPALNSPNRLNDYLRKQVLLIAKTYTIILKYLEQQLM